MNKKEIKALLPHATEAQAAILYALERAGTVRGAARDLGIGPSSVRDAVRAARNRANKGIAAIDSDQQVASLKAELKEAKAREALLLAQIDRLRVKPKVTPTPPVKPGKAAKHIVRLVIPDFHGEHIDPHAKAACLADAKALRPEEIVYLGDGLDCGGTFSTHQRNYTHEMVESFESDVCAANLFLDELATAAPNARQRYIFGNHEQHIERWAAREFQSFRDANFVLDKMGPAAVLNLKARGIEWFTQGERYDGLSVPGTIKLGKCYFTHGMSHAKHAADTHLRYVGANVVFGHVHRVMSIGERNVQSDGYGAWCPGTLAKLQPLYRHTAPTSWQHGYGVQFVNQSTGTFVHFNVPIANGVSLLHSVIEVFKGRAA